VSRPLRRRLAAAVLALTCVAAVALAVRVVQVHQQGWEWRLTPSAAPPRLTWHGRDYRREDIEPSQGQPYETVAVTEVLGRTPGGGLVRQDIETEGTPTVLYVETARRLITYTLMGGP
jgi:hypothetical protein